MERQEVLPRDAILSIDDPSFTRSYFGDPDDEVLVVEGNPAKAYPIRILSYHEIVNDRSSGALSSEQGPSDAPAGDRERPIAVTWCPLCASAIVYDRWVDGRVLTFGTSGALVDDALVMYDRETESEWKQPLGEAIRGPLVGTTLTALPVARMTWSAFESTYPDGVTLQPEDGGGDRGRARERYEMSRYEAYHEADDFGLRAMRGEGVERTWDREDIEAKTAVLGVVLGDDARGYPAPVVEGRGGIVTDSVGGVELVVFGGEFLAAFEAPGFDFERRDGRLWGDGTWWDERTGRSDDGRQLTPLPSRRLYAFAWQDDHGSDSFYGLDSER